MPTFEQIISAEFDFAAIEELFFKLYTHPYVDGFVTKGFNFIDRFNPLLVAAGFAFIALIFAFFGKKLMFLPIAVGSFVLGFVGGAVYVAPRLANLIGQWVPIEQGVVGIIFGIICAVFCLPIYYAGLALAGGYSTYLVAYPVAVAIFGKTTGMVASLACAVGIVIVIFVFCKWFEMAGTAVIAARIFMLAVNSVVLLPAIINYIIWFGVAIAGSVVQIKTRKRY